VKKVCGALTSRSTSWSALKARSFTKADLEAAGVQAHQPRHLALSRRHDRPAGAAKEVKEKGTSPISTDPISKPDLNAFMKE